MSDTNTSQWNGYTLNGCVFETSPAPAPTLCAPQRDLPQHIDLRAYCSPIENQKKTNSCVANAVVGALEFHQKKAGLAVTDMSRLFVYYNARALADQELNDGGSLIHHGMAAIMAYGACETRMWPFQEAMLKTKPTQACYENASHYEAIQYARTPRGISALSALAQGLPVVFGIFTPNDYYEVAAQTGVMPTPNQIIPSRPPSGHAMLIVGYDLAEQTYLVRNSWGVEFADNGYLRIPFKTMDAWAPPEAFWTIGAIEKTVQLSDGLSLSGPTMSESMRSFGLSTPTGTHIQTAVSNSLSRTRNELRSTLTTDLEKAKQGFRDRLRSKE